MPGGHVSQGVEDYGMHHWGEVITYVGGFVMPMIYGVVLLSLGGRLLRHYDVDVEIENESGYVVGFVMLILGYVTVLCCIYAQFCEYVSRIYSYNPKVNVTNQDTFVKRASIVDRQSHASVSEVELDDWNIETYPN